MSLLRDDFKKRPFSEHLSELFVRIRRLFIWFIICFLVSNYFASHWIEILKLPLSSISGAESLLPVPKMITTNLFDPFWTFMRVSIVGAFFMLVPFLAFEVGAFAAPGLTALEKRRIFYLVISFIIVFLMGIFVGHRWVIPEVLKAILRFGVSMSDPYWTLSSFINTSLGVLLVTGLIFELPVLMTYLSFWGWVSHLTWRQGRRFALVGNALISAVLSPPDIGSMLLMMLPVQILYECGVWLSYLAKWNKKT
jgi:sec-independent protein translocase protein TatC